MKKSLLFILLSTLLISCGNNTVGIEDQNVLKKTIEEQNDEELLEKLTNLFTAELMVEYKTLKVRWETLKSNTEKTNFINNDKQFNSFLERIKTKLNNTKEAENLFANSETVNKALKHYGKGEAAKVLMDQKKIKIAELEQDIESKNYH